MHKTNYIFKAHPTKYNGVEYRSRLEATWACFFDMYKWKYKYEPYDLQGWTPDFELTFPCWKKDCGSHTILIEVKPYTSIAQFEGHPCTKYHYGGDEGDCIPADASACFGLTPEVTEWEMCCGDSGGMYEILDICRDSEHVVNGLKPMQVWKFVQNKMQYKPRSKK